MQKDWFNQSTQLLGSALNCEVCLFGMKGIQWFLRSQVFENTVLSFGYDVCWLARNHMMLNSCTGYLENSVPAVIDSLTSFMLSPEYACERELTSCINHEWYTPLTTQ